MTTATATGPARIGQIRIPVRDLARAVGFYRDTLGLRFLFEVPGMAFFDCGGVRLMLGVPDEGAAEGPGSILYYVVPDIHAAHEALRQRGAAFVDQPHLVARMPDHELWMTFLRDPEENLLALMSEARPAEG